jgi:hypothetical protein
MPHYAREQAGHSDGLFVPKYGRFVRAQGVNFFLKG